MIEDTPSPNINNFSASLLKNITQRIILYVFQRLITLIRIIIFAHVFLPSSIGFLALLQSLMGLAIAIGNIGFRESIIRDQDKNQKHIDTIYTITIITSFCLWLMILISAIYIKRFINNPDFEQGWLLLSLMAFTPLGMLPSYCWERDLSLTNVAIPNLISEILTTCITLTIFALSKKQIESLFIGYSLGVIISWIWIWYKSKYKFSIKIDKSYLHDLFSFGFPLAIDSINSRISLSGDSMLIGKYWGTEIVGFYTNALAPFQLTSSSLAIIDSITLPIFAKYHHENSVIEKLFTYLNMIWAILGFGSGCFIFLFSDLIVHIAFGQGWEQSIPLMRILSISFAFRYATGYAYGNLAIVRGRTSYLMKWGFATSIFIFTVGNYLIHKYASIGAAWFWIIQLIIFVPLVRFPLIIQELGNLDFFKKLMKPILAGLISSIVILCIRNYINIISIKSSIQIVIYLFIYFTCIFLFDKDVINAISYTKNLYRHIFIDEKQRNYDK